MAEQLEYADNAPARLKRRTRRALVIAGLAVALIAAAMWFKPLLNHAQLLYYQRQCLTHVESPDTVIYENDVVKPTLAATKFQRFYSRYSPPGGTSNAVVFLHELRHKDGSARLVALDVTSSRMAMNLRRFFLPSFDAMVVERTSFLSGNRPASKLSGAAPKSLPAVRRFRLYAGQPDPADASHFTIKFDHDTGSGLIDGWLQADDTILLELREATKP